MPVVRTTNEPHKEIEVSDAEYLDLKRWGLLVEMASTAPAKPTVKKEN